MNAAIKLDQITREIEGLDYDNKINLMARMVSMLKWTPVSEKSYKITDLKGLGRDIWENVEIEEYIKKERESWGLTEIISN